MFEIRYHNGGLNYAGYYTIQKDGVRWSAVSYKSVWDAIDDIELVDPEQAAQLSALERSFA